MPRRSPFPITLSEADRTRLLEISGKYFLPYMAVVRAKIILLAAEGKTNDQIGRTLGASRQIVSKWRKRFFLFGFDGLNGFHPRGRPPRRSRKTGRDDSH